MGKFKKGIFLGGLFGAASMWLMTTTKGKHVRGQILDSATEMYGKLEKELKKTETYNKLTKARYTKLVKKYVDKYAVDSGLATEAKKMVVTLLNSQWKNIRKQLK